MNKRQRNKKWKELQEIFEKNLVDKRLISIYKNDKNNFANFRLGDINDKSLFLIGEPKRILKTEIIKIVINKNGVS